MKLLKIKVLKHEVGNPHRILVFELLLVRRINCNCH